MRLRAPGRACCCSLVDLHGQSQESLLRTVRAFVIFAGSEEVMLDLGARQMVRLQRTLQDAGPAPRGKVAMTAKV
jgi:hypothetical protein